MAVDVPLECPRLCGLCDRYDALQRLRGDEDLQITTSITAETTE